ncbi:MAG TPA: RNA polymerase sigma factor [Streptosporangiaceae bacterium]|jgi:RNA polymerase sigma-70 factor (ECF subfamily)
MEGTQPAERDGRITDPDAFEAAFRTNFPPVYRFIARRVGAALAEDLAAETFAIAYRRRTQYEPTRGSLRSWLYGVANNLVRNHWRAEQHLLLLDARVVPEADLSADPDVIDQRVTAALLAPRLAAALSQLGADQRDVLLLHAWAELSHDEIAAALQIAPGTARSRLSRARAVLREQLGDFDFNLWMFERPDPDPARGGLDRA